MAPAHARQTLGGMVQRARCARKTTLVRCASRVPPASVAPVPTTSALASSIGLEKTAHRVHRGATEAIARTGAQHAKFTAPAFQAPPGIAPATRDGKGLNVRRVKLATTAQNALLALQQVAPLRAMEQHAKTMVCAAWTLKETHSVYVSLATTGRSVRSSSGAASQRTPARTAASAIL